MKHVRTIVVLIGALFVLSGCRIQTPVTPPASDVAPINAQAVDQRVATTTSAAEAVAPAATTSTATPVSPASPVVKEFRISAENWEFSPNTVTVAKGDAVRLIITSVDVEHGVSIPAFQVSRTVKGGEIITVEFVADRVGVFPFRCTVFCGDGHKGMTGTIVVTE